MAGPLNRSWSFRIRGEANTPLSMYPAEIAPEFPDPTDHMALWADAVAAALSPCGAEANPPLSGA
jgi:hypothetical protein